MRWFFASAATVSAFAVGACSFHLGGETNGARGNAQFSYSECLLGCNTTTTMMLDDEEDVSVSGSIPDAVSVESSAPAIVSIAKASRECCTKDSDAGSTCRPIDLNGACASGETASLTVTVDAHAAGSAGLVVKMGDGSVWDSVTLSVEPAASLALACNTPGSVTLANGGACPVTWKAADAKGQPLMSSSGIRLTTSDPSVAVFNGFLSLRQSEILATPLLMGGVSVFAVGTGDATVTATGGGATETLAVHVTP